MAAMSLRRPRFAGRAWGELVAAVVVGVVGVPLGPGRDNLVAVGLFVEGLPQVLIDDGLFGRGHPALALPAVDPGGDAVLHIFRIGDHFDFALFAERFQPLNRRGEFHAVIGGVLLRIPYFFLLIVEAQDGGPTVGSGITEAGAIGADLHVFH